FVDGVSARLVPLLADGLGEAVTLDGEVHDRHRQGGWHLLAQSRYQRHIQEQRGHHFDAFAAALTELVDELGVERIVLASARHGPWPCSAATSSGASDGWSSARSPGQLTSPSTSWSSVPSSCSAGA